MAGAGVNRHRLFCARSPSPMEKSDGAQRVSSDETILLTIFLKHDQSKNLEGIQGHLAATGWWERFPPEGVEIVSWNVVMGIGQALSERTQLDSEGRQRNPHLLDYKLATASDVPRIDVDWIQNPAENGGPRGSKGVGEPPSVPTAGAIGNAIAKVIEARVRELPMTPERVWAAGS